jgi:hypothetical protein
MEKMMADRGTPIEVQTTVGNVTPADLDEFRRAQAATERDIMGEQNRFVESARYDPATRGITSSPEASFADAYTPPPTPEQPALVQPPPAAQPGEADYWKQRYGTSENEKGEWRRLAEENSAQVRQLNDAMEDLRARVNLQQSAAPQMPYGATQAYPQQQAALPQEFVLIRDRAPDEVLTVADMNRIAAQEILPGMQQVYARATNDAYQRALADAQRMIGQWDVTPREEADIRQRFPEIGYLPLPSQNRIIQEHVRLGRAAAAATQPPPVSRPQAVAVGHVSQVAPAAGNTQQPPRPVIVDPASVMRKTTYIESAPPAQSPTEPQVQAAPEVAYQQELAALDAEWRKRGHPRAPASENRKLLLKYGMPEVNDFSGGTVSGVG